MGYRSDAEASRLRRAWIASEIARLEPEVARLMKVSEELAALRREHDPLDPRREPKLETWASGWEWDWCAVGLVMLSLALAPPMGVAMRDALTRARCNQTRFDAQAVRSSALLYQRTYPRAPCPTVVDLAADEMLHPSRRTYDAWDHPFRIVCDGDETRVTSAGPDGSFDTADDIE